MDELRKPVSTLDKRFKNLTPKIYTLVLGMIFVGVFDVLPLIMDKFKELFVAPGAAVKGSNILMAAVLAVLIGALDVFVFCVPLFDLFKVFKKETPIEYTNELRIKLFKVYIIAHLFVSPIEAIIYYFSARIDENNINYTALSFIMMASLALTFWFYTLISKGINTLYNFKPVFKMLVFWVLIFWSYLVGTGLNYALYTWISKLFRQ